MVSIIAYVIFIAICIFNIVLAIKNAIELHQLLKTGGYITTEILENDQIKIGIKFFDIHNLPKRKYIKLKVENIEENDAVKE